ncbi:MAG TPA: PASTA domain-containing protein, partial [Candidatus Lustribacter sp.]|nr:PASTA domain-containing protein [Candidatus Lustribacter sp.]
DMFLVMELVPGRTLRQVLADEGALTPRAALTIIEQVLQALDAAHRAGLIHRDIKPENVMLDERMTVKVTDFGLARAVTTTTMIGQPGVLLGTASYLAPEQVERGVADARSDVYAVGLLLFEMLTGSKAVSGDNPIHVAYQHVHGSVPAPSSRVAGVPATLDALVAHATSRDPDDRPRDAGAMLADLRNRRADMSTIELDLRPAGAQAMLPPAPTVAVERTTALPVSAPTSDTLEGAYLPSVPGPVGSAAAHSSQGAQRRGRVGWVTAALVLALVVVGGWFFTLGPAGTTTVPTTVGLSRDAADSALQAAGLTAEVTEAFDETAPKDQVMTSDPASGQSARKGTAVSLTVSKGPERYSAPTLVGTKADGAKAALAAVKLALGEVKAQYDEKVAAGVVISQAPAAGQPLKPGATVSIVVSKGREPIPVTDYTGKPADAATAALTKLGLTVTRGEAVNSDTVPQGSIISQSPKSGTLFKGATVTIVVSKGPVLIEVPGVVGMQRADARRILERAGFTVRFDEVLGGFFGTVRSQDPAGGSKAARGTTVSLVIV